MYVVVCNVVSELAQVIVSTVISKLAPKRQVAKINRANQGALILIGSECGALQGQQEKFRTLVVDDCSGKEKC